MKFLFWLSLLSVNYIYWGYPALLAFFAKVRPRPVLQQPIRPTISLIMAVRDESSRLTKKLHNIADLQYPGNLVQIIVASDGSSDDTAAILQQHSSWITPVILDAPQGKAVAINKAVQQATGEILVFFDVRQYVHLNTLTELVACFADPEVGAVSGELHLKSELTESTAEGVGIYWKLEKLVRRLESASGSVIGVTGAIYAMRRALFRGLPPGAVLDDVLIPMQAAREGWRVVFQPSAIAQDVIFSDPGKEFSRKIRTLSGNYQMLRIAPWLISFQNPLLFRFICHKILRLAVPFLMILMLLSSALVRSPLYEGIFAVQVLFYGLAAVGISKAMRRFRSINVPYTLTALNLAALIAFRNFVFQNNEVWRAN